MHATARHRLSESGSGTRGIAGWIKSQVLQGENYLDLCTLLWNTVYSFPIIIFGIKQLIDWKAKGRLLMKFRTRCFLAITILAALVPLAAYTGHSSQSQAAGKAVPQIEGPWWTVATNPDLGPLEGPPADRPKLVQQPVDFAIWQAIDGTWQIWSCIRHTKCGGMTRLFYRWQGNHLTDTDWKAMGIVMQADTNLGETLGGLQAPYVFKVGSLYHMVYGNWTHICSAVSQDGKTFMRQLNREHKTGMFTEAPGNSRDPMVIKIGNLWHCYYTASCPAASALPRDQAVPCKYEGADYCRTSRDLRHWSASKVVAYGGRAGGGPWSAECPFVVAYEGYYYLFRTQHYGENAQVSVYRSKDPMNFGVNDDSHFVCTLPVAAPEIFLYQGQYYIAALSPDLQAIQIARLKWVVH